jgi:hypothetical protein
MRTLSLSDVYINALYVEAMRSAKTKIGTHNVRFDDRAQASILLMALRNHPKPGKAYLVTLQTESGITQSFEVEPLENDVFRVTFKKP